jgi:uncharacterized DUF497 family protein
MRFDWDDAKSEKLKRERGLSFEEAVLVFSNGAHLIVQKSDDPEQFAAIGFARGELITIIYEYREDEDGELSWLITYWKATKEEVKKYEKSNR